MNEEVSFKPNSKPNSPDERGRNEFIIRIAKRVYREIFEKYPSLLPFDSNFGPRQVVDLLAYQGDDQRLLAQKRALIGNWQLAKIEEIAPDLLDSFHTSSYYIVPYDPEEEDEERVEYIYDDENLTLNTSVSKTNLVRVHSLKNSNMKSEILEFMPEVDYARGSEDKVHLVFKNGEYLEDAVKKFDEHEINSYNHESDDGYGEAVKNFLNEHGLKLSDIAYIIIHTFPNRFLQSDDDRINTLTIYTWDELPTTQS